MSSTADTAPVAIVTGSSSGIGEGIARALAARGTRVVVNSRSSVELGQKVAAGLDGAIYVQANVAERAEADRLVQAAVDQWGRLDYVVNNAGTTHRIAHDDLEAITDQVWRDILDTNVVGTWHMIQAAVPEMRKVGGGSIVNITSLAGLSPGGSSVPYASSKAALNHMTRLMARALAPTIRVNAVAPGLVDTPWTSDWSDARESIGKRAPLGRIGTPEDMAGMTIALLEESYITGVVVPVDGGVHLGSSASR